MPKWKVTMEPVPDYDDKDVDSVIVEEIVVADYVKQEAGVLIFRNHGSYDRYPPLVKMFNLGAWNTVEPYNDPVEQMLEEALSASPPADNDEGLLQWANPVRAVD